VESGNSGRKTKADDFAAPAVVLTSVVRFTVPMETDAVDVRSFMDCAPKAVALGA